MPLTPAEEKVDKFIKKLIHLTIIEEFKWVPSSANYSFGHCAYETKEEHKSIVVFKSAKDGRPGIAINAQTGLTIFKEEGTKRHEELYMAVVGQVHKVSKYMDNIINNF